MSARAAAPKTVTEYLAAIPEAQRADAQRLHKLIRKTAPALKPFVGGFKKLADLDEAAVVALVRAATRARKTWAPG